MSEITRPRAIETLLADVDAALKAAPPSAAVRELRVRHGSLSRIVGLWSHQPPHEAQIGALLECVIELHAAVVRAGLVPARPASLGPQATLRPATTRPPPRRLAASRTTRPAPKRASSAPPTRR